MNFFDKKFVSIGKKLMNYFLNLNFLIILEELKVFDVTRIFLIFLLVSNFSNRGTMLWSSPTLAP